MGQPVSAALNSHPAVVELVRDNIVGQTELSLNERQYELRVSPLTDRRGRLAGRLIVLHDVTTSRAAAEALRHSQAQLSGIINTAQDAIITLDGDYHVVLFNAGAERMFGCRSVDVIGQTIDRFVPERARGTHTASIQAFAQTGVTTRTMGAGPVSAAARQRRRVPYRGLDLAGEGRWPGFFHRHLA